MPNKTAPPAAPPPTIRVLTVDDHELLRRGISFSLLSVDDIQVVAEARNGAEAVRLCDELAPNVVLMDMFLTPDMDGLATTRAIRSRHPEIQVLALSSFHDHELVHGALQAGAIGYLVKGISGTELARAIRAAHAGQSTLSAESMRELMQPAPPVKKPDYGLTEREMQVLALLVVGASNAEIADKLVITVATAKYHIRSILAKMGAANRTEAAALAREYALVSKK